LEADFPYGEGMVAKLATLAQLLEETGYQKSPSGQDVMWRLSTDDAGAAVRAKIEILERKSQFHISKCTIQIDSEKLSEILKANIKKRMPRLLTWLSFTDRDGRLRSIAEIAPQNEKKDLDRDTESLKIRGSGTSIGWTTSFTQSNGMISIQLTDAFSVGDPIANWWADMGYPPSTRITYSNRSATDRWRREKKASDEIWNKRIHHD
jgi:hypothetical protein